MSDEGMNNEHLDVNGKMGAEAESSPRSEVGRLERSFADWSEKERREFQRIVNKLLSKNFIVRYKDQDRQDFFFIKRREEAFRSFFDLAGWTLRVDPVYDVYQLINPSGSNRRRFNLEESLIFLIVRLLFEQRRHEVNLADVVMIKVADVQDVYLSLRIRERPLDKGSLQNFLRVLRDFSLLEPLESDLSDPDTRLIIYPSIVLAVSTEDIQSAAMLLERYRKNGKDGLEDEAEVDDVDDMDVTGANE
jgi:hypothetical protein